MNFRAPVRTMLFTLAACAAVGTPSALAAGDPTMPLSGVEAGMVCTAKTVLQGTTISDFTVTIVDVVGSGIDGRILGRASGPGVESTGVAQGFSGSPVYCPAGDGTTAIVGAVSAGTGDYGNLLILITPIETMLTEPRTAPTSSAQSLGVLTMTGVTGPVASIVQRVAKRAGRQLIVAPGVQRSLTLNVQPKLVPGSSVAVGYSTGAIVAGGVGTVTYVDGDRIWAFGHPLDGAGRRQLLLQNAYVHAVVGNPLTTEESTPYKLASPFGAIGTLTDDRLAGVSGVLGTLPRTFPLTVSATNTGTGVTTVEKTEVTDEIAVGSPGGVTALEEIGPVAVAQAAVNALHGAPSQLRARMCASIRLVGRTKPLSFCNRYVNGGPDAPGGGMPLDLGTAVAQIVAYQRKPLHIAGIDVQMRIAEGPGNATVTKITTSPKRARPGQRIRVSIDAVVAGTGEKITRVGRVRVPRSSDPGDVLSVGVRGDGPDGEDLGDLEDILSIFESGDDEEDPPPASLTELAKAVSDIKRDDRARIYVDDDRVRLPLLSKDDFRLSGTAETYVTVRR